MLLKSLRIFIATLSALLILAPVSVAAVDVTGTACQGITDSAPCKDSSTGTSSNPIYGKDGILTKAVSALSLVIGIVSVIILIVAGIQYTLSGGDGSKTTNARNTIIYAAVGIGVTLMAQVIVNFVLSRL